MNKETNENTHVSEEWVMINAGDPMNFYVGHLVADNFANCNLLDPKQLRTVITMCMKDGTPLALVDARLFMTMLQPTPQGGLGLVTQLTPISGSGGPVTLRIKATAVIFPADTRGMAERITEMAVKVTENEQAARAKAAGILIGDSIPNSKFGRS